MINVPAVCFRAYDIRGPVDDAHITDNLAFEIGRAIGSEARLRNIDEIVIARDGRASSYMLFCRLTDGIRATGVRVLDIGLVPTPLLYFATHHLAPNAGVMITGSHNPPDHNGFKIVLDGKTLSGDEVQRLYQRICDQDYVVGEQAGLSCYDIVDDYIQAVCERVHLARKMRIAIDCGNGAAGVVATKLFRALGCEVDPLFCDVDGSFPNHHPDPSVRRNMLDVIIQVIRYTLDAGFAFDGDGDRVGFVTNAGRIVWPDQQMMLFCRDILPQYPDAPIIFDVKCSRNLAHVIEECGGKPVMWRTGHSFIKNKAAECNAPLAGELSGHIFFRDRWFGFDDGLYVAARMLEILSNSELSAQKLSLTLPDSVSTEELKIAVSEAEKAAFMQRFIGETDFGDARLITIDGVRVEYPDGWALVRASNTSACLTLRFEADSEAALAAIQQRTKAQLLAIDPDLEIIW